MYHVCVRHDIRDGIPFPDATFDVVNCADVLGHFDEANRDRLLTEIHRVLRPGAWFIATVETWSAIYERNMRRFPDWYPALYSESVDRTGHVGLEPARDVVLRLERHGFRILRKQFLAGNWGYTRAHVSWTDKYPTATRREAVLRRVCALAVGNLYTEALMDDVLGLLDILSSPRVPEDDAIAIMVLAQADDGGVA
jgi:SAM-dependent methyltransferase